MNYITVTFLRSFLQDLPLLITSFFCLYLVFTIYLPKENKARKWIVLVLIEFTEHIILPIVLIVILLLFNNWLVGFFFNIVILLFIFVFLGYFVLKARTKEAWKNICVIALFVYFFIYVYPLILISVQMSSSISGWWIIGITNLSFLIFFIFSYRKQSKLSQEQK